MTPTAPVFVPPPADPHATTVLDAATLRALRGALETGAWMTDTYLCADAPVACHPGEGTFDEADGYWFPDHDLCDPVGGVATGVPPPAPPPVPDASPACQIHRGPWCGDGDGDLPVTCVRPRAP